MHAAVALAIMPEKVPKCSVYATTLKGSSNHTAWPNSQSIARLGNRHTSTINDRNTMVPVSMSMGSPQLVRTAVQLVSQQRCGNHPSPRANPGQNCDDHQR